MQVFKSEPEPAPVVHKVGDKVMFKGIGPLIVHRVEENAIYAYSSTMQIVVGEHALLDKAE